MATDKKKSKEKDDSIESILDQIVTELTKVSERVQKLERVGKEKTTLVVERLVKEQEKLTKKLQDHIEEFTTVRKHVNDIQAEPVKEEPTHSPESEKVVDNNQKAILDVARTVLGNGDPEACQFNVSIEKGDPGLSFKLVITPPEHLKEHRDDKRVKMIPNLEAETGVKSYAEQVKSFCVNWAQKNGKPYMV
jgi:hypothetical protein